MPSSIHTFQNREEPEDVRYHGHKRTHPLLNSSTAMAIRIGCCQCNLDVVAMSVWVLIFFLT